VRSAFTYVNSPIGKNVRLCGLKYGIGEGDVVCWRFSKELCVQCFIYGLPRDFVCMVELCVRVHCSTWGLAVPWFIGLCIIGGIIFFPLLTLLRIIDVIDAARFITILINK